MSLRTEYPFTLPRGYVDDGGTVHRKGVMRLATARDELEPLRHPMVSGPDDPRLTVQILARVVTQLGTLEMVTSSEIEGLFAADLAFLQDFYGVINFGSQEEYEELLAAQDGAAPVTGEPADAGSSGPAADPGAAPGAADADGRAAAGPDSGDPDPDGSELAAAASPGRPARARVEEIPRTSS